MPRPPRVEFLGAIYHLISRGDGRRRLFHDDGHYQRLMRGLKDEVQRSGWQAMASCWMPNHIHLLFKTPEPNLSRGMQHSLSGYANWYAKRNQRSGAAGRDIAAYLCRRWTGVSLAKLSALFGLEHPDSSSNLVRRAKQRAEKSLEYRKTISLLETKQSLRIENQL